MASLMQEFKKLMERSDWFNTLSHPEVSRLTRRWNLSFKKWFTIWLSNSRWWQRWYLFRYGHWWRCQFKLV